MKQDIPECPICGTWVCMACGWKRLRANRRTTTHTCHRCGGTRGSLVPSRHRDKWTRNDHIEAFEALKENDDQDR